MAVASLSVRSCLIDWEAIVCDDNGLAVFDLIRDHRPSETAVHCVFDLLELDGEDLRRQAIRTGAGLSFSCVLTGVTHRSVALRASVRFTRGQEKPRLPTGRRLLFYPPTDSLMFGRWPPGRLIDLTRGALFRIGSPVAFIDYKRIPTTEREENRRRMRSPARSSFV
jgi:hypothetical protein